MAKKSPACRSGAAFDFVRLGSVRRDRSDANITISREVGDDAVLAESMVFRGKCGKAPCSPVSTP
jgi:hypothetical protein